ncbi:hypothetical protein DVH05_016591 [Phytophthora capsici]|nr:hypothetical protein DVH05_016591 [Phytophthora capsici]
MIRPAGLATKPQTEFVALSYRGFTLWWVAIFFIHLSTFLFNACYAKFYWIFGSTQLSFSLDKYDVGMAREYFHAIAYVHIALACLDGGLLLLMVVGSFRKRSLVFSPWSESTIKRKQARNGKNVAIQDKKGPFFYITKRKSSIPMLRRASATYANIANRRGALGVNRRYFYAILVCREIVETAFQTEQAFRMSRYLSRFVLNRFYVSLLVINCWSPMFIHTRFLKKDEARRRLAAIVLDCTLDLMSAMGVSIMIVLTYVDEFDPVLMGFSFELLDNDNWFAQMLDEARIVLVSSWLDLISRAVFGLGIIITTASMKQLLRWKPIKIDIRGPSTAEFKQRGPMIRFDTRESKEPPGDNCEHSEGYSFLIPRNFWCNNAHLKNRARHALFRQHNKLH